MDSLLPLLCLATGSALPLAALFLVLRRGMRQLAVAHAYREVAQRLGLSADTRGVSLQGHLGDRRLWIGEVMVGHGPDRRMMTWGVVDLQRPLGLGMLLRRRGLSERLFRRSRAPETRLDDDELDRLIEVRGDEPERIRQLMVDDVRQALHALVGGWRDVVVTDQSVRVHLRQPEASGDRLQTLVDAMLRLAGALERAREEVAPPSHLDALRPEWEALASAHELAFEPWLPAASGQIDGRRVLLVPRRDAHGYTAELRLYFRDHPEMGFRLRPQTEPDGYWSVGQDIQVDDPVFDGAFVVKGWDPQRVRELLDAEVRGGLLQLAAAGSLEVDDRCLRVRNLPLRADELGPLVRVGLDVAERLGW